MFLTKCKKDKHSKIDNKNKEIFTKCPPPPPNLYKMPPPHPKISSYFFPQLLENTHFSTFRLFYVHIDIVGYFQTQKPFFTLFDLLSPFGQFSFFGLFGLFSLFSLFSLLGLLSLSSFFIFWVWDYRLKRLKRLKRPKRLVVKRCWLMQVSWFPFSRVIYVI